MTEAKQKAIGELVVILAQFFGLIFILGLGLWKMIEDDNRMKREAESMEMIFGGNNSRGYYDTAKMRDDIFAKYVDSVIKLNQSTSSQK